VLLKTALMFTASMTALAVIDRPDNKSPEVPEAASYSAMWGRFAHATRKVVSLAVPAAL